MATTDAVVAATGEDTSNVLACAFAAAEGEAFTVAVVHRLALLPMIGRFGIDAALSPRTASANAVLQQLRGGGGAVATFLESDVEVNEFVVQAGSPAGQNGASASPMPSVSSRLSHPFARQISSVTRDRNTFADANECLKSSARSVHGDTPMPRPHRDALEGEPHQYRIAPGSEPSPRPT